MKTNRMQTQRRPSRYYKKLDPASYYRHNWDEYFPRKIELEEYRRLLKEGEPYNGK